MSIALIAGSEALQCYTCTSANDGSGSCGTSFVSSDSTIQSGIQTCSGDTGTACVVS